MSDNFGYIGFDTHHCPHLFTLPYQKPVHQGDTVKVDLASKSSDFNCIKLNLAIYLV